MQKNRGDKSHSVVIAVDYKVVWVFYNGFQNQKM